MNDTSKTASDKDTKTASPGKNAESNKICDFNDFGQTLELIETNNEAKIKNHLSKHIKNMIDTSPIHDKYKFIFLYIPLGYYIEEFHADNIYNSLSNKQDENNIFLVLNSTGGRIEPAYLISKCCQEHKKDKFAAIIPRYAKSAATLIALGANEIHMGSLSQLGPIDPQINGLPALSLNSALECIAKLCERYPRSSIMFAEYLTKTMPLKELGYFERIPESAKDYAMRLLKNKNGILTDQQIGTLAHKLVYGYKDHSFVIDKDETLDLLGNEVVKFNSDEYKLGNNIYTLLEKVNMIYKIIHKKVVILVGSENDLLIVDLPKS